MRRERLELGDDIWAAEVHPANHAANERIGIGTLEQPTALRERLPRLHGYAAADALRLRHRRQISRQKIPRNPLHAGANPRILRR